MDEVLLRIPNIGRLSDEELEGYFRTLDGRWSSQTKALLARHKAVGLDLNRNWALSQQLWFCPCCLRYKPQLVRKAENGILIARLETHHDHIRDAVKKLFNASFGTPRSLPPEALHVESAATILVERFSEELVCFDCNTADGFAKKKIADEVHADFSFTPAEIRTFIEVGDNRPHGVVVEKALEIWKARSSDFRERLRLADGLIQRLREGQLRRERTGVSVRIADAVLRSNWFTRQAFMAATRNSPNRDWEGLAVSDFVMRSTSNDGAGRRSSLKTRMPAVRPSDSEFEVLNTARMESSVWRLAGADWQCCCCGRSKRDICRKSNAGKWTAHIHHACDYVLERDPTSIALRRELYPAFAPDPVIGDCVYFTICQDCAAIGSQLKAQRPDIGEVFLSSCDIRELVGTPEANRNHERDFDSAAECAIRNLPLSAAVVAFREHVSLASGAGLYYRLGRESMSDAEARVYAALRVERERGWEERKLDPFIDWLLKEGARLEPQKRKPMI